MAATMIKLHKHKYLIVWRSMKKIGDCFRTRANLYTTSIKDRTMDKISLSAERIVGYQTNLLRCLLSDEISSVLVQSKKLVGSRHPLLKTARNFIYDRDDGLNSIGLIVLLISRSAENLISRFDPSPLGQNHVSGIQEKQRKLAEVAEMINTGSPATV